MGQEGSGADGKSREHAGNVSGHRSSAYQFRNVLRFSALLIRAHSGPLLGVDSLSEVHSPCLGSVCLAYVAIPHVYKNVLLMLATHPSTASDEPTAVKSWQPS